MGKRLTYEFVKEYIENERYKLLSKEYKSSESKLKVRCLKGHIREISFHSFQKGRRCPICSDSRHTYEYVKAFIENEGYTLVSKEYINSHTKLKVQCDKGHKYEVDFSRFSHRNHRCLICSGKSKHSYDYIKEYFEKENYTLLSKEYINNHTKLKVKCGKGHEYFVIFNDFQSGHRCPICNHCKKITYDEAKKFIEERGYRLLSKEYNNNSIGLKMQCNKGHIFEMSLNSFKTGRRCRFCFYKRLSEYRLYSYEKIKFDIERKGYTLLSKEYIGSGDSLDLKCPEGHIYKVSYINFIHNHCRCSKCYNKGSVREDKVYKIVEGILGDNIEIIRNDRIQIMNPNTGRRLELDVWIPEMKKAIEFNGKYWHSKPDVIKRDEIKKEQCLKNGIDLLVIKEREWINNKEDVLLEVEKFLGE